MAYMNQETKKKIKVELDKVLKGTGIKYSLGVRHHSTLVLNISRGPIDFIGNYNELREVTRPEDLAKTYIDVNVYRYRDRFSGEALEILSKVIPILNTGNYDNSRPEIDYFDKGFYVDVNIGKWDKPYVLVK